MENTMKVLIGFVFIVGCSSKSVPSDVSGSSGTSATTATSPLTLSTAGTTSIYENATLQLYVLGGTAPYQMTATGGAVSTAFLYTAPATAGSYLVTATDALGVQANITILVVDPNANQSGSTTNTTTTTTTTTAPTTKIIFRFFNSVTGMHSFSDVIQDSQGGAFEGPAYRLLVSQDVGSVAFYRCSLVLPSGVTGFFDTTDPTCEGQVVSAVYPLGFIYTTQSATGLLQPLYRFYLQFTAGGYGMIDHMEYPTNPYAPDQGWMPDQNVMGWVPVQ